MLRQRRALGNSRADESERGRNDGDRDAALRCGGHDGAEGRSRTLGLRVAAVDLFTDIGGDPDAIGIIEVNSNPSIRLLEESDRGDLILKIWRHTFSRHGIALVFDLPKYGDGVCLARMAELLDVLAVDRAQAAAHLGGGDGLQRQGLYRGVLRRIGRAYGLRTGLFTSPHLYRFNERFQVDGAPIGDDDLARLVSRIEAAIAEISQRRGEKFGAFEAMFALACLYFQERECDFAVFEAGIGGRYDPVRLVGALATCVTSVDYEHVELLGHSLELIVSDKSDACASGGTIVYGENCRSLRPHLIEYNRHRAITSLFVRDQIGIGGETVSASAQRFDFRFGDYEFRSLDIGLLGAFQFNNAAIAITLFLLWLERMRPAETPAAIEAAVRSGLRDTRWPGRLEVIRQEPLTVIDVGHTPDGIRQSLASLKAIYGAQGWILVVGVSFDKKIDEIVGALAPSFDTIICTTAHHKGGDAETIAAAVRKVNPQASVHVAATIEDAVQPQPDAGRVAQPENLCGRRIVHRDRIRHRRPRRPRAGAEFLLRRWPAESGAVNGSLTIPDRWFPQSREHRMTDISFIDRIIHRRRDRKADRRPEQGGERDRRRASRAPSQGTDRDRAQTQDRLYRRAHLRGQHPGRSNQGGLQQHHQRGQIRAAHQAVN